MPIDVLVADPPWQFRDKLPGPGRGAEKHYACMPLEQLKAFPLPGIGPNAVLFLWRVASMQEEALAVARAWGFTIKSEIVWLKTTRTGKPAFGMGHYTRAAHETCLIGVRGKGCLPAIRNVRSTFSAPLGVHSRKPDAFYGLVRAMYPHSRKIELFARVARPNFEQHGDQLGSIAAE